MELPSKEEVLALLLDVVARELATARAAQEQTLAGATHEESRPENDKDTRALESSYLARGQAKRVVELGEALLKLQRLELRDGAPEQRVSLGRLLVIEEAEASAIYFMAPAGGGIRLALREAEVRVITPEAPLGRALLGKMAGDDVEVRTPQGVRELSITEIV